MEVSIGEKKKEAIERMRILKIYPETIRQFEEEGYISISEPPFGAFYWAKESDLNLIREFEEKHDALVYVVARNFTEFGKMDSYFYVSDDRDEWEMDRNDLNTNEAFVFVQVENDPSSSEFGYIRFKKTLAAGILRIL